MTQEQFDNLRDGDVIRSALSRTAYIVQRVEGVLTAMRVAVPIKAAEWDLVAKASYQVVAKEGVSKPAKGERRQP